MSANETIQVTRSSMPPMEEYFQEIAPLWGSHWLTNMGKKHEEFQALLRDYLQVERVALFTNGHSALECILEALQLGSDGRREVITTPFTFASTTHAIVRKGLQPVFADIKASDYTIDPDSIERLVNENTCAILPVHVYGNMCDAESIQAIADKYNLKVIYDAAHAFGVSKNGINAAWLGDASMFSFHATKVFHTIEGGAVCFKDPTLFETLNQWKNFGITGPENVEYIGGNAKMNEFCAAMGICNLRYIETEIAKRKRVAERYHELLASVKGIQLQMPDQTVRHNYAYMPVLFQDDFGASRDDVFSALAAHGVKARKYFYPLTSDFACYRNQFDSSLTPIAQQTARSILTLPIYADLDLGDVDRICEIVIDCCGNRR